MSGENLELVRSAVARFAAGDMEGVGELYTDDAVSVAPEGWPESGRSEGREAVVRQFERLRADWRDHSMQITREATGGDHVVLEHLWTARGAVSGAPFQMAVCGVYRVAGDRIAEARFFWEWPDALAAAGLRE